MNENLNLVDMLKYCPKGTKLYSVVHGEVKLEAIVENDDYPIKYSVKTEDNNTYRASVSVDGKCHLHKGECTLFPSKENRDWSKFNRKPKFDISTLKPFDKVLIRDYGCWFATLFSHYKNDKFYTSDGCAWWRGVPYNEETKHLVGTCDTPPKKYITWRE